MIALELQTVSFDHARTPQQASYVIDNGTIFFGDRNGHARDHIVAIINAIRAAQGEQFDWRMYRYVLVRPDGVALYVSTSQDVNGMPVLNYFPNQTWQRPIPTILDHSVTS